MGIIIAILLIRLLIAVIPSLSDWFAVIMQKLKLLFSFRRKANIFDDSYINVKCWYLELYKKIPCATCVADINGSAIFDLISSGGAGKVISVHQRSYYNWQENRQEFICTVFRLSDQVILELGDDFVQIYFDNTRFAYAEALVKTFATFKAPEKEQDYEINIITLSNGSLQLKPLPLKPMSLDVNLFYNDDFAEPDALIRERLSRENDKGIVLLHGLPGTGKTSYLRHLIGGLKKRVLFVSPLVAGNLMNPEFIDLLLDHPNCILVIEDAENLILDRRYNSNSSVSNLLNISDGLLSDCLNVQIICTFNSALSSLDSALLRKGRLIARYEFDKLTTEKAAKLSRHLGYDTVVEKPMTLAELTNRNQPEFEKEKGTVIGFRKFDAIEN